MGKLRFEGLGLMDDYYQQPEDDGSLQFWMWCEEEESDTLPEDDDESIEIEIIPEDLPF